MFTSNYARASRLPPDLRAVSISIKPPYWWKGPHYPPLCPTKEMLSMATDYNRLFEEILSKLDPRKVFDELGENAVMLCFESPNISCHRRLCAQWLEAALDIVIPEYGFDRSFSLPYSEMPAKPAKPRRAYKKWDQADSLFEE